MGQVLQLKAFYEMVVGGQRVTVRLELFGERVKVKLAGKALEVNVAQMAENVFSLILDGCSYNVVVNPQMEGFQVFVNGKVFQVALNDPSKQRPFSSRRTDEAGSMEVSVPMPGKVVKVLVSEGDSVQKGQGLVVVEAMKMQNEVRAPRGGEVKQINVSDGETVNAGEPLVVVE